MHQGAGDCSAERNEVLYFKFSDNKSTLYSLQNIGRSIKRGGGNHLISHCTEIIALQRVCCNVLTLLFMCL